MSHYVPPEGDPGFTYLVDLPNEFVGSLNDQEHVNNDTLKNIENIDYTGSINAVFYGDEGNNFINGGSGDDYLYGGDGNDNLKPEAGNDFVYGEAGDDILVLTGSGTQTFHGGEGIDTFKLDGLAFEGSLNPDYPQVIEIDLANGISGQKGNTNLQDTLIDIENINYRGSHNVEMTGDEFANIIISDEGDDLLYGGDGNDVLKSGSGDDFLYGEAGDDILILTGSGTQTFHGGEGNDTFKLDYLSFDSPSLNPDFEQIIVIDLANGISGQKGNTNLQDTLISIENITFKGYNDAELTGDESDNEIRSYEGDDLIYAGGGNDEIRAQKGNDTIFAQDGDDYIRSGKGADVISTGLGNDIVNTQSYHAIHSLEMTDIITDFEIGNDKIELEGILYSDISINQGMDEYSSDTILSISEGYLAILENVNFAELSENDFIYLETNDNTSSDNISSKALSPPQ